MATPQTPRRARSPFARYGPLIAVIVVVAIVAITIGVLSGSKSKKQVTTGSGPGASKLPVLYDEAKANGTLAKYTWQPHCDTTTGNVAIPILNAPPCVPVLSGGNGGATSPGVTATTIKIGYYIPKPDPTYDPILKAAGAYDSPDDTAKATVDYMAIYSHLYELYGRRVQLVRLDGTGLGTDAIAAHADADRAAAEGVFAVMGGPTQAPIFQDELARKHILCIGTCVLSSPASKLAQNAPYIWGTGPTPEQAAAMTTELVKKQLVGKDAVYAGDPKLRTQPRRIALLSYDTPDGEYKASWDQFYSDLGKAGAQLAGHVGYFLNPKSLATDARTVATKLKATGATTIVFTGDPIFPSLLTTQMTQQGYFPEWVMSGTVLADTDVFARKFDQRQWAHAFGLQLIPARLPKPQQDSYSVHEWWFGTPPPTQNNFALVKGNVELLMDGIQLAGPDLTPQAFRDGLWHIPPQASGTSLKFVDTYGRHGLWPGIDYGGFDNAGILYWDPNAVGSDETGSVGKGMYRLLGGGVRYLPGQWPSTPVKLFDPAGTVTVYSATNIPSELRPPTEPVPPDAPAAKGK